MEKDMAALGDGLGSPMGVPAFLIRESVVSDCTGLVGTLYGRCGAMAFERERERERKRKIRKGNRISCRMWGKR